MEKLKFLDVKPMKMVKMRNMRKINVEPGTAKSSTLDDDLSAAAEKLKLDSHGDEAPVVEAKKPPKTSKSKTKLAKRNDTVHCPREETTRTTIGKKDDVGWDDRRVTKKSKKNTHLDLMETPDTGLAINYFYSY